MAANGTTRDVVLRTVKLRAERAALLGYANHAAYQLEDQTAKNVETVNKLLAQLAPPAVANAHAKEAADMQKMIDQENGGFQSPRGTGRFIPRKFARRVTPSTNRKSIPTSN